MKAREFSRNTLATSPATHTKLRWQTCIDRSFRACCVATPAKRTWLAEREEIFSKRLTRVFRKFRRSHATRARDARNILSRPIGNRRTGRDPLSRSTIAYVTRDRAPLDHRLRQSRSSSTPRTWLSCRKRGRFFFLLLSVSRKNSTALQTFQGFILMTLLRTSRDGKGSTWEPD